MRQKTFLIACGGTGGHLSPGIAAAQELTARGHRCILLISKKSADRALSGAYPELSFIPIPGVGFSKRVFALPRCLWETLKNIVQSFRLLRRMSADAVIGFGGFTNIGAVLTAFVCRKPCFLHEANRIPGRAVRTLGRLATVTYVPEIFKDQPQLRMKICGFPIRRDFRKLDKAVAKRRLGFDPQKPLLVLVGGSQGARVLYQWAAEHAEVFRKNRLQVLCLTGIHGNSGDATAPDLLSPKTDDDCTGTETTNFSETARTNKPARNTGGGSDAVTGAMNPSKPASPSSACAKKKHSETDACNHSVSSRGRSSGGVFGEKILKSAEARLHLSLEKNDEPAVSNASASSSACFVDGENLRSGTFVENTGDSGGTSDRRQTTGAVAVPIANDAADEKNGTSAFKAECSANEAVASSAPFSAKSQSSSEPSVRFLPFFHQMHVLYSAADLVVGRAGAGTIAELTQCETPSILIPLPNSADGHQRANARAFEQEGGCRYLDQADMAHLWECVRSLLSDPKKREAMSACLRVLKTSDAAQMMVTDIEQTLGIT